MIRTGIAVLATAVLLVAARTGPACAEVRRERPERRPYIVEVGQPFAITGARLEGEVHRISAAREYVGDYGYPDYAEIQEVSPEWPWEAYELRFYYMRPNVEVDFGPVFLSEALPNFGVLKYRGDITPEKRREIDIVLQARQAPPTEVAPAPPAAAAAPPAPSPGGVTEALVARIEAAAERATQAADRAAQESEAAALAAERTVNIVDQLEREAGTSR